MLLTISTDAEPATDLGFLLHKHPQRPQAFDVASGTAHVFYPEASDARCTAALLLEVDPVALVRGRSGPASEGFSLGQYVNDRPYAASSLLAVALSRVFKTAMSGRCDARPELATQPLPLTVHLPVLPCRGGSELAGRLFGPLGWQVDARAIPLDETLPQWGDSRYLDLRLSGTLRLADALQHLYVLLPVLDDAKHYWVGQDEVDKLIRAGEGWLAGHPERELITNRYLAHQAGMTRSALARLAEVDDAEPEALDDAVPPDGAEPAPRNLAQQRRDAVLAVLREAGAHRVGDLGCGEGVLTAALLADPWFTEIVATDVSARALQVAARRLRLDQLPEPQRARLRLLQSSLTYRDARLAGLDALVLMEVVEHLDPPRLPALERTVFEQAHPVTVVVTTPNAEHNVRFAALPAGTMRHRDHRFEWTRAQFRDWAGGVAERRGYGVRFLPVGFDDPDVGPPTQLAVFTPMTALSIPQLCLVVLVGASGSGKSSFARAHFAPTEVLSSDACRGLVSDDENDQGATKDAFDVLHYIAGKRLARGLLTVVDATNVQPDARKQLVALAKEHDVLPVAIVLDLPERVCVDRNASRPDRDFGAHVVHRQHAQLRRGLRGLDREGFRGVHVLRSVEEVDAATVTRARLYNDLRDQTGPFDVIGDIHGCRAELESLLTDLGYAVTRDGSGQAVGAAHPDGRRAVFVGDLVDRGPDTPGVLRLVMGMVAAGTALCVPGNHENKLLRALRGRNVQRTHGLAESLDQLAGQPPEFRAEVEAFLDGLVSHYVLDGGALVVSHAGLVERYHGRASGRVREFCLYGQTTGETDEFGLPVRYPWAQEYRGRAVVLYGHVPTPVPEWVNNTLCLDTGCVFGGRLTALRYPERELVSVPAAEVYYEPAKPFPSIAVAERDGDLLDLDDVLGRRVVETGYAGRVSVREENAAAALEVMSRFALDPRWLLYLPPTMSPVATSTRPDLLEHPDQAFDYYRSEGVGELVCEEKHMGSRAVVLLHREGHDSGPSGAIWTRTGRPFFDPARTELLLTRLRRAAGSAGLFDELDSPWVLLDAELLPWSAKAEELLRHQYAAVGAAARAVLPAALAVLDQAQARGLDVAALRARTAARSANALGFTAAYRQYCWPVNGIDGVRLAPFQVLASQGAGYQDRPHAWHLNLLDRLVAADPRTLAPTARCWVDTADPASCAAATGWWESLTESGGEGMVVKPAANLVRGRRTLVQPGVKVRGREYLRLIYGPDYTEPANLDRLRTRNLGHKRSMAVREYALGLEALDRVARGEPLWRVHECVFAVLALESEPVDPRL